VISSLQEIFQAHLPQYLQNNRLHLRELRAANAIVNCRTPGMGGHVVSCPEGHFSRRCHHSCGHRSCPRCADGPRQAWLGQQLQRLLPCDHYHAVFTLPHDFLALWSHNRQRMTTLMFDCARQSLLALCADERHLGATPGILMSLHTWGRTLSQHPHVHCLVSGGGLDAAGQWKSCRSNYLVPVLALAALFRGKLLHHLQDDLLHKRLTCPPQQDLQHWQACIRAQYRKHWNVQLSEPYAHGRGVALYLARYVKGGPLPDQRRLQHHGDNVSLSYTDHRDHQGKTLNLRAQEFIARVLWHAPPAHQHTVRHCGLYATSARRQHQAAMQQLSPAPMPQLPPTLACLVPTNRPPNPPTCPQCNQPLQRTVSLLPAHRFGEISRDQDSSASDPLGPTFRSSGIRRRTTSQRSGGSFSRRRIRSTKR